MIIETINKMIEMEHYIFLSENTPLFIISGAHLWLANIAGIPPGFDTFDLVLEESDTEPFDPIILLQLLNFDNSLKKNHTITTLIFVLFSLEDD